MKILFVSEVRKSVLKVLIFAKFYDFVKSDFWDLVKFDFLKFAKIDLLGLVNSDFLDRNKFVKVDGFLMFSLISPLLLILLVSLVLLSIF